MGAARARKSGTSEQRGADHLATIIGQALVAPVMAERQPAVVDPEQVQDCRVNIVNVRPVLLGAQANGVGGADHLPALDAATGQPHREAMWVVVAPGRPLTHRRASELAAPDNERFVQQPARLEVLQQARDWPVALTTEPAVILLDVRSCVPTLGVAALDLPKAVAALHHSPPKQTAQAELRRLLVAQSVQVARGGGSPADIDHVRRLALHAERQLAGRDAGI